MKRWSGWIALSIIFTLMVGCSNANNYIKETYPLVDVQGAGKENAKIYSAENQDVPTVAHELAQKETPKEKSKESTEKMFLIYKDKIINIQKDPANEKNSLIEIDSIQYAKNNYASDFLKTYLTATILQSVLGGRWFSDDSKSNYGGYSSSDRKGTFSSKSSTKAKSTSSSLKRKNDGSTPSFKKPSTSKKSGSFTKKKK